jgi:hypothetical protein
MATSPQRSTCRIAISALVTPGRAVTFQKDAKGTVTGLVMDQAGRPQRELKKIK